MSRAVVDSSKGEVARVLRRCAGRERKAIIKRHIEGHCDSLRTAVSSEEAIRGK
jgi:hypothetical protein